MLLPSRQFILLALYAGLLLLLSPCAVQAQTFNFTSQVFRQTSGSGKDTQFTASGTGVNPIQSPVGAGLTFNTNVQNYYAPPNTGFGFNWRGTFTTTSAGTYIFTVTADDGFRCSLTPPGGAAINFGNWSDNSPSPVPYSVTLAANTTYALAMDYYENGAGGGYSPSVRAARRRRRFHLRRPILLEQLFSTVFNYNGQILPLRLTIIFIDRLLVATIGRLQPVSMAILL